MLGLILSLALAPAAQATTIVNQNANDVTLLRAYPRAQRIADVLDLNHCKEVSHSPSFHGYDYVSLDCTEELEHETDSTSVQRPFLVAGVRYDGSPSVRANAGSPMDDPIYEFQLVAADESLAPASAVGIVQSGGWVPVAAPKDRVRQVAKVTLKDGRPATVLRFVMPFRSTGFQGSMVLRDIQFKPFIDYPNGDTLYRNWDAGPGTGLFHDYAVSNFQYDSAAHGYVPRPDLERLDRAAEVLKP